jgi:NADPH:quinone reductase-like Zn-dependent oxidoreductase
VRAVVLSAGALGVEDRPDPEPPPGHLLVRVRACGLNNADLLQRAGSYPAPPGVPADIPGLEFAGEVVGAGGRVMALVAGGGQAELAVVDERHVLPVPDALDWPQAGGFMEVFATAHDALFRQAGLAAGERLLVNGGAGGVGVAAVQLGACAGADVVATVRDERRRPDVAALGAEAVAPGAAEGPFDVVLELVGGGNLAANVGLLATGGRVVVIGTGAGARAEVDFLQLMARRGRILASTLRARPADEKAEVVAALRRDVLPLLEQGRVVVPVEAVYPLAAADEAYARFAAGGKLGKIVLVANADAG